MRFELVPAPVLRGQVEYVLTDHAFGFRPETPGGVLKTEDAGATSLALGTLQLEVSLSSRRCLWLWGYSPRTRWVSGRIAEPTPENAGVEVADADLSPGVSLRIFAEPVREIFDKASGWFGVFASTAVTGRQVCISTNTVLLVEMGELRGVLVRPANWRELVT